MLAAAHVDIPEVAKIWMLLNGLVKSDNRTVLHDIASLESLTIQPVMVDSGVIDITGKNC